jgi:hypothetical protein
MRRRAAVHAGAVLAGLKGFHTTGNGQGAQLTACASSSTPPIVEIDVGCRVNACIALAAFVPR